MKKQLIPLLFLLSTAKVLANCFGVYAEGLYLHTTETADWALVLKSTEEGQKVSFETVSFDWDPGFRVGVRWTNFCECWDTHFRYTRFRAKATNRAKGDRIQSEFFGSKLSDVGFFQRAKIETTIDSNLFDWEVGRTLWVSPCLSLRPMIGLKGGWINQSLHTSWEKTVDLFNILIFPVTATENLRNNFWGIGPQTGVQSRWLFSECVYLAGELTAAFMWGHWAITDRYQDSLISKIETKVADRSFGAIVLQGFLGLGFDVSDFFFQIGYEIQDWFNQYQVFDNGTGGHNNDLLLQGLRIQAGYSF